MRNYGFDPWQSPEAAVRGAAAILRENYQRTGDWGRAVQQYIGGLDPSNYGPTTGAYVDRVMGGQ